MPTTTMMLTRRTTALLLAAGTLCTVCATAPGAPVRLSQPGDARHQVQGEADLPIRSITLYRSGVGYFERSGTVSGDTDVQLRFDADQINDILKSMVLLDLDGGRIEAVSYASKEPLSRRLGSFGVDISGSPTIADLLRQLRGSPIEVTANGAKVEGTILGVSERTMPPVGDSPSYRAESLELLTSQGMRAVALSDVSSYRLLDETLAEELRKALGALAEYRADNVKSVDLVFNGRGERRVVVGYIHETPVWKTSYRLVLKEGGQEAILQGWAIVENTTDQDWTDVALSLVAGRPVSFRMDLYEPLFTERPEVPVPTIPGIVSRAYDAGLAEKQRPGAAGRAGGGSDRLRLAAPMAPAAEMDGMSGGAAGYEGADFGEMNQWGAQAMAGGTSIGEVFQFRLNTPVTIERQQSAMIPLISVDAPARRVSIYTPGDGEHPMRGVELRNDSELQLLPGPIAVFDSSDGQSSYAGDAQINHVSPGDERLLAYAVDLDVIATTEEAYDRDVVGVRIVDGVIEQTDKTVRRMKYGFDNKDREDRRTIIVEHPKLAGWELVSEAKPAETTPNAYRFEVALAPGASGELEVDAEHVDRRRFGIVDYDLPTAVAYHAKGRLSDEVLAVLRDVAARQGEIADLERRNEALGREADEISRDQQRIRSNMGSISSSSDLYERYMTKLSSQETRLEALGAERAELARTAEQKREALRERIRGLSVR